MESHFHEPTMNIVLEIFNILNFQNKLHMQVATSITHLLFLQKLNTWVYIAC
mgnify:CR=1 FL=1